MKSCVILLCSVLIFACGEADPSLIQVPKETREEPVVVPARNYTEQIEALENERSSVSSQYRSNSQSPEVIESARRLFTRFVYKEVIPYWYETEWDFYGTTETPQSGKIACGYFVTTVLRDAGLRVERAKLAQQASEKIILTLTNENHIKRFRNKKIEDFVGAIEDWGEGLYIVGLDFHVGFIVNDGGKTYFIHSSYIEPRRVVRETAADSKILASSKYRIAGKISDDNELLAKWLLQEKIATE